MVNINYYSCQIAFPIIVKHNATKNQLICIRPYKIFGLPYNNNRRSTAYQCSTVASVYSVTTASLLLSLVQHTRLLLHRPSRFVDVYCNCRYRAAGDGDFGIEHCDTFSVGCYSSAVDGNVEVAQGVRYEKVSWELYESYMVPVNLLNY